MIEFTDFYALYPRKEAKKDALKAWGQITEFQRQKALNTIEFHVKRWEMLGTSKEFIPLPSSWLRGERFDDEVELPQPKAIAWWATEQGILLMGSKVGVQARPGEPMAEFKQRVANATRKTA